MKNSKIPILQIIKTLTIGGAERFGIELTKALNKDVFEPQICVFFQDGSETENFWLNELKKDGIKVQFATQWKGNNHFNNYIGGIKELERITADQQIKVTHSHFQLGTLAALYLRSRHMTEKVVRTAHNHPRCEWEPGWYGWARYQMISKWIYPLCIDAEVAVSQTIGAELQKHPGANLSHRPVHVIYNAISSDRLVTEMPIHVTDPDRKMIVGSIGRLTEQKGYTYLIKAIAGIVQEIPRVEFWLIGDGELRANLEQEVIATGCSDHVKFLGKRTDIPELFKKMDLFVLPSLWEGLPTVILESMAAHVPVVATDIPGTQELIRNMDTGFLIPARDPAALASTIIAALRNPEICNRVAANAHITLNKFMINAIAVQYENLYRDLLQEKN
jgi:glycosyltransferase involved in cell wall biosynthesis